MEPFVLQPINAMAAPTWHRLAVNDTSLTIPNTFERTSICDTQGVSKLIGPDNAFVHAMDALQLRTFGTPQAACSLEMAQAYVQASQDVISEDAADISRATETSLLENRALSAFQARSQAIEATKSVWYAFETGMGKEAYTFMRNVAASPITIQTPPKSKDNEATLIIPARQNAINIVACDVVIADESSCHLSLVFDNASTTNGIVGASTRIFVGQDATLHLHITQTAPDEVHVLDDLGIVLDKRATVTIEQNVFGSAHAFEGCAIDLRGDESQAHLTIHYIAQHNQKRDFNYLMRHHGNATISSMKANGVLTDTSLKTLRGTIDFVTGCKNAEASEQETVLLTDKTTTNRSVPVILCGEDDVAGSHGATIGSMNPEQLFYLESHGISTETAKALVLKATVENAYLQASNPAAQSALFAFGKARFDNFDISESTDRSTTSDTPVD